MCAKTRNIFLEVNPELSVAVAFCKGKNLTVCTKALQLTITVHS